MHLTLILFLHSTLNAYQIEKQNNFLTMSEMVD